MSNPLRWGTNPNAQVKPPLPKRNAGHQAGRPEAAQYENWWKDLAARSMERVAMAFMAVESDPPSMSVRVLAGAIFNGAALTEVAGQVVGPLVAPTTHPRVDRVVIDSATGTAAVVTGTEASSPALPAIPTGTLPVCRFVLSVGQTSITQAHLTDERATTVSPSEWIRASAGTWISSAASAAGTVFSMAGDTRALFQPNRRVRLVSASGDSPGTVTRSAFASGVTTITVDMQRDAAGAWPTVGNPITALYYAIENAGGTTGLPAGGSSRSLELGAPRYPWDGSARTGIDLYGPVGSNLVAFTAPPNVVAPAGGAGDNQTMGIVNGISGSLIFIRGNHGRVTGQVVQLSVNAPPNTVLATSYIVSVTDVNTFGLYAIPSGWQFQQPYLAPSLNPGGLTWGNPVSFDGTAAGPTTVTPGFVAPVGVTRVKVTVTGAGGGGGGSRGNTGNGGTGVAGGNTTFSTMTGMGGNGGDGGSSTSGGDPGTSTAVATGGTLNLGGNAGSFGEFNTGGGSDCGKGGPSFWGGSRVASPSTTGSGGPGGQTGAANQGGGGGGNAGSTAIGLLSVVPGTWLAVACGTGGLGGAAGTGTNSQAGQAGGSGVVMVEW